MNKTRLGLAIAAGVLGLLLGCWTNAWGFEQGAVYAAFANSLLIVTLVVAFMRVPTAGAAAPNRSNIAIDLVVAVAALLFGAALLAALVGSKASDANSSRYLMVAAAFVPLAIVKRQAHHRWNVMAPLVMLVFAPAMTGVALIIAGDIDVWMNPALFVIATFAVVIFAKRLPSVSDKRADGIETGLATTVAFITGVTAVSSSYDYDARPAVIIGLLMTCAGWFFGVVLRRWNYAPSRAMTWQNVVIGVWIGQFMPGAALMSAMALASGWALYGVMQGLATAIRKARARREGATA